MQRRHLFGLGLLVLLFTSANAETQKYATFEVEIYKDSKCTGKVAGPPIVIDTSKSCNSYSYVDSKGVTTVGSQNNVRCYKDKVVYDKYPFSSKCLASESVYEGKEVVEKNHSLTVGVCTEAPSHEGPVYEMLEGYRYLGSEDCKG